MQDLSGILNHFGQDDTWQEQRLFQLLLAQWVTIVGASVAAHTRPTGIHRRVLQVAASSPVWAQNLSYERRRILQKIQALGQLRSLQLKDIRFSSAEWHNTPTPPSERLDTFQQQRLWQQHPSRLPTNDSDSAASPSQPPQPGQAQSNRPKLTNRPKLKNQPQTTSSQKTTSPQTAPSLAAEQAQPQRLPRPSGLPQPPQPRSSPSLPAEKTVPKTTALKTTALKTTALKTMAPGTTMLGTTTPGTTAPKTTAPKTTPPQTTAPQTTAPQTTALDKTTLDETSPEPSFEHWEQRRRRQNAMMPPCPNCQCPTPQGELQRWSVCAFCATQQWQADKIENQRKGQ